MSAVLIVTGLYLVCVLVLALAQRRMMYFPCGTAPSDLQAMAEEAGFRAWRNDDGQAIGWQRQPHPAPAKHCILILHGNAGCAADRFHYADSFQAVAPFDVCILEYPGYGGRPGSPSQTNLLRAAQEGLKHLRDYCAIYVVGESLGTGVAAWLAGAFPDRIAGLYLVAPYNNMTAVARNHLPLFPVRAILRDKYPASRWLSNYRGPLAVLLAGRDEVIPVELGRNLYETYPGPKKLWIEPNASHNDIHIPDSNVWKEVVEFWNATAK